MKNPLRGEELCPEVDEISLITLSTIPHAGARWKVCGGGGGRPRVVRVVVVDGWKRCWLMVVGGGMLVNGGR